jgi:hypothetical protein
MGGGEGEMGGVRRGSGKEIVEEEEVSSAIGGLERSQ